MSQQIRQFIIEHDRLVHRLLEMLPGTFSWGTITLFFSGSFLFPLQIAYLVILFDVFWLYKSITFAASAVLSYLRIKASEKMDWLGELEFLPDWKKAHHIIIIPQYKEPLHILQRALNSLANQDFPTKQMTVVLACEARDAEAPEKAKILQKEFAGKFGNLLVMFHQLVGQEVAGKASNENYAARWVKKNLIDQQKMDIRYIVLTSSDADHCFHPKHFSCLTYSFLDNPQRYLKFWQPAVFYYNNFWRLPAITRVVNTFGSIWNGAILSRKDRLISCQNYSLSFKLLDEVDYWNPEIIPEDYHIFFKAYYKKNGQVETEPIFLPVYADAAEGTSFLSSIKNTYQQFQRWAWGVSDDPNVIKNYLLTPTVSFWDKTIRLFKLMEDHLLMPTNWFFITLGITIPTLFVKEFSKTALGYTLPQLSGLILSFCLIFLVVILIINAKQRPPRPTHVSRLRAMLLPLEFVLMPISGLIFGAIPGLDAHTRLMLGKYLEYRVTKKF